MNTVPSTNIIKKIKQIKSRFSFFDYFCIHISKTTQLSQVRKVRNRRVNTLKIVQKTIKIMMKWTYVPLTPPPLPERGWPRRPGARENFFLTPL